MPAVFVHGVPDTNHLWDGVLSRLSRKDTMTVSLPGFGPPVPAGFASTKEEYLAWLIGELEAIGEPVDLVGHDWGALLVERTVCVRPDLIKTWVAGGAALDEGYEWHTAAKIWQTPDEGEKFMAAMTPEVMAGVLTSEGVPDEAAGASTQRIDDTMKASILSLYRSAVNVSTEWAPDLDKVDRPGMLIWGENDPYMTADLGRKMAKRTGAEFTAFEGCSHWWPVQRPKETAEALDRFWSGH